MQLDIFQKTDYTKSITGQKRNSSDLDGVG